MANSRGKSEAEQMKKYLIHIMTGSACGTAVFFLLVAVCALAILKVDFPEQALYAAGLLICAFSAFLAGFIGARPDRKKGIAFGAASCVVPIVCVFASLSLVSTGLPEINSLIVVPLMLLFGCVGGIVAVNMRRLIKK